MALRWIEGFEGASSHTATHSRIYETGTGTFTAEDGVSVSLGEAVSSGNGMLITKPIVTVAQNSWIVGAAFRAADVSSIENASASFVGFRNDAGEQIRFEFAQNDSVPAKPGGAAYSIRVMRGAVELAQTTQRFRVSTDGASWVYFEFKVTIDNATGSFEGRYQYPRKGNLNAASPTTLTWDSASTGLDTQEQATSGANRFVMSFDTGSISDKVAMDDVYVCDSTGTKNNDYLGKIIIEGQKPASDGDTVAWTLAGGAASTQDAWDEPVSSGNDDKRTTSDVTAQVHLATVDPLVSHLSASIVGLRQDFIAKMETTGTLGIGHRFRKTTGTPAEVTAGTDLAVSSTTYDGSSAVLEDDPNTALAWVVADLDSYQHGVINNG